MNIALIRRARHTNSGGMFGFQNGLRMRKKTRYEVFPKHVKNGPEQAKWQSQSRARGKSQVKPGGGVVDRTRDDRANNPKLYQ